jgi:hypothetical protein
MPDEDEDVVKAKKRKEKKARIQDGGKTLLPFSRVQKIIKADKVSGQPYDLFSVLMPLALSRIFQ